jgi:hypothetical protein
MKLLLLRAESRPDDVVLQDKVLREAESWLQFVPVVTAEELDRDLPSPEFKGWTHVVGASGETTEQVLRRARANPARLTVVMSPLRDLVREVAARVSPDDARVVIALEKYDHPGGRILQEMARRPPWLYGAFLLRSRIPGHAARRRDYEFSTTACRLLFVGMLFGERASVAAWGSRAQQAAFSGVLSKARLKSETKIREALYALSVWYWMAAHAASFERAVVDAGGKSVSHARKLVRRVLGVSDTDLLGAMELLSVLERVDGYMQRVPGSLPPPPLAKLVHLAAADTAASQVEAARSLATTIEEARGDAAVWLDEGVMQQVMDAWYTFVWQFVGTHLPSDDGRKQVCQAVFTVVGKKWLAHQVRDSLTGAAVLDMSETQQRASLVNVCLKECANYFRSQRAHEALHVSLHDVTDGGALHLTTPGDSLDVIIADETREEITRLIETRKPAEAQIGREALLEGLSVDEIAERHGIEATSVATIVSRVRRFLRAALGGLV